MTNYQRTAQWLAACGKQPGDAKMLSVAIGVHIEEMQELLCSLLVDTRQADEKLDIAQDALAWLADWLKRGDAQASIRDRLACLDALCDCEVTGNGIAFFAQMDKEEADRRVLDSNESKLVDGKAVILPGGKIGKGPNYKPPVLDDLV